MASGWTGTRPGSARRPYRTSELPAGRADLAHHGALAGLRAGLVREDVLLGQGDARDLRVQGLAERALGAVPRVLRYGRGAGRGPRRQAEGGEHLGVVRGR